MCSKAETCDTDPQSASQVFHLASAPAAPDAFQYSELVHVATGLCVASTGSASQQAQPVALVACKPDARQRWVFGKSGRLCADEFNNLCIAVDAEARVGFRRSSVNRSLLEAS